MLNRPVHQLVVIDLDAPIQLVQMVLSQPDQRRENHSGRSTGRVEIAILDRCIDTGIGLLLQRFQHCEQPPQPVRQIGGIFIQFHLQDLLIWMSVFGFHFYHVFGSDRLSESPLFPGSTSCSARSRISVCANNSAGYSAFISTARRSAPTSGSGGFLSRLLGLAVSRSKDQMDRLFRSSKAGRTISSRFWCFSRFAAKLPKVSCKKKRTASREALGASPRM